MRMMLHFTVCILILGSSGGTPVRTTTLGRKRSDDISMQALQTLIQQQSHLLQEQSATINALEVEIKNLQTSIAAVKTDTQTAIHSVKTEADTLRDQFNTYKSQQKVAFSTTLHSTGSLNIGTNSAIRFDRLVTNIGNAYNPSTGTFTAPVAGIYAFFLSIRADNNTRGIVAVSIYKSNVELARATVNGSSSEFAGHCFVTTHLAAGESVMARHIAGDTYVQNTIYTNFSGLLQASDQ